MRFTNNNAHLVVADDTTSVTTHKFHNRDEEVVGMG